MAARPLPKEQAVAIVKAVQAAVNEGFAPFGRAVKRGKITSIGKAAADLGVPATTLRSQVMPGGIFERCYGLKVDWEGGSDERRAARGQMGFEPVLPGYEIKKTSAQYGAAGDLQKEWVQQSKAPGARFEMPEGHKIKGVSTLVDPTGRTIVSWIKTREDDGQGDMVAALTSVFEAYAGRAKPVPAPKVVDDETLTVYPIADMHVGMYSWAPETGDDYDLAIVEELFIEKMGELVAKASPSKTAIVLNLGDYFHSDSRSNRTEQSGVALDVDSRYARVLQIGVRLMVECIELALIKHESVLVRSLPGNHDYHASLALTVALGAFFRNNPRVTVDASPSKFFVHRFGKTLIAATHGDMAKAETLASVVAARWPEDWGATRFRFGLTGHVHHKSKFGGEACGMIVESFQTLAAKDWWHASMGFVSGRSLVAITYDKQLGESARVTAAVPAPERMAA